MATVTKQKRAPIAPNDTQRPDFGILSDLLGEEVPFSEDLDTAVASLKKGLLDVYQRNPKGLVLASSAMKRTGKSGSKSLAFMSEPGAEVDHDEFMSFVIARLWNRNKSGREKVHKRLKDAEVYSSNAILSYDPEKSGVLPHINARVGYIVKSYFNEKSLEQSGDVSLDSLQEKGLELNQDQVFVKQRNEDAIDLDRVDGQAQYLAPDEEGGQDEGYVDEIGSNLDNITQTVGLQTPENDDLENTALGKRNPKNRINRNVDSPNRADLVYLQQHLGDEFEFSEMADVRSVQLSAKSIELFESKASQHPEYEDMLEVLNEWNPEENILQDYAPDVIEVIDEAILLEAKELETKKVEEITKTEPQQLEMFAVDEVEGDKAEDVRYQYMDEEQIALDEVLQAKMWRVDIDGDQLNSSERIDYVFLCNRARRKPSKDIEPKQMHKEMIRMAKDYMDRHLPEDLIYLEDAHKKVRKHAAKWDPSKEGFTRCVTSCLEFMADEGITAGLERRHNEQQEIEAERNYQKLAASNPVIEGSKSFGKMDPTADLEAALNSPVKQPSIEI